MNQELNQALEFEKRIAIFYLEKGAAAQNLLVEKLFLELAKQEIDHLAFILSKVQTRSWMALGENRIEIVMKDFFTRFQPLLRKEDSQKEALLAAIELEKSGCAIYQQLLQQAPEQEREFCSQILAYDEQHLAALENVHFYLTGTGDWWQQDESRRWNWMNT
ncbi:MAG: hypothetical protein NC911_04595 [Candidatus Omnitrophica bacterium]|nr:hypothetical protein [Candidatus Omnitrophota bacterium]